MEESKKLLQKQTTQLKTAHDITKSIRQSLDINKTLRAITNALVTDADFSSARIKLFKDLDGNNLDVEVSSGADGLNLNPVRHQIIIDKELTGELIIYPKIDTYTAEVNDLLNYLLPIINVSIHDSLVLRTITDYKENLESKVEDRTFELKKAHEELSQTINLLKEAHQSQNRFFTNISHEFRTPLTLIFGPANDILDNCEDKKAKQNAGLIKRNASRLYGLVNDLLDLSKIEAGKMKLETSEQDIIPLLKGLVLSFSSLAETKKITLRFNTNEENLFVFMDRDKIEKIVNNLLSNAFKFTPEEGKIVVSVSKPTPMSHPRTEIKRVDHMDEVVEIIVSDNGIGIATERLEKIFDRFYQVDGSHIREREGTGIGLALTKELIELHKGKIYVESKEGTGTTFTVLLPLGKEHLKPEEIVEESAKEIPETEENFELNEEEEDRREKTDIDLLLDANKSLLLIVEDNSEVRKYIISHLENDYRIQEAVDGEDGMSQAFNHIPDLIISDVMMPKMDGFELCNKMKTDERTSHIPIILLTAKATNQDKIEGYETGADDYIMKPFDVVELKVRIKNLIEIRRKLQEKFSSDNFAVPKELSTIDEQFMKRVLQAIDKHISEENFSIEELSEEAAMSRIHLYRKLKALTGKSPSLFIRSIRLIKARKLIKENGGTISEIAYDIGFGSPAYFTKCFKEEFGCLPSELIK